MLPSLLLLFSLAVPQDPAPDIPEEPSEQTTTPDALRRRINDMRMNLLLGGDRVRQAETEAIGFYGNKVELIDQRMDTIRVELSEKEASYELALERTLESSNEEERREAMREAATLRSELSDLELESDDLDQKRTRLSGLVTAVEARDRERERLVAQLETSGSFDPEMGLPFTGIGLAPVVPAPSNSSPLDDNGLVDDLMSRDPRGARRILFEMDPEGYWSRFPLQPPAALLHEALPFPLPDLPGER